MLRYVLSIVAALAMSATVASATSYDIDLTSGTGIAGTGGAISVSGCVGPCESGGFLSQAFSVKAGDNVNFGTLDLMPVVFDFTAGGRNPNTYEVVAAPELEVLFYDGTVVQPMSISLGSVLDQCAITNASECNQLASIATLISLDFTIPAGATAIQLAWTDPSTYTAVTPLPGALPLFSGGILLLGFVGRHKKKRARNPT